MGWLTWGVDADQCHEMKILLVGNRGGSNIGESFERAAQKLSHEVQLVESKEAFEAPGWLRQLNWRFLGRRPTRLKPFGRKILNVCDRFHPDVLI